MSGTPRSLFLLCRVRKELHAALDERLASDENLFALTAAQLAMVMTLATSEPVSSTSLCERMSYDTGAMTRMLDRLQSKGVIRRRSSPEDRRVVYVELTEEGRAALPRMHEIATKVLDQFLHGFSDVEVRRLESYLARLLWNTQSEVENSSALIPGVGLLRDTRPVGTGTRRR